MIMDLFGSMLETRPKQAIQFEALEYLIQYEDQEAAVLHINGISVELLCSKRNRLLKLASQKGLVQVVKSILDKRAPSIQTIEDCFRFSAMNGHIETLKLLLTVGTKIARASTPMLQNVPDEKCLELTHSNNEALNSAIAGGHATVVEYLLSFDTVLSKASEDNQALREAILYGRTDIIELLFKNDTIRLHFSSSKDYSILKLAFSKRHYTAALILLDYYSPSDPAYIRIATAFELECGLTREFKQEQGIANGSRFISLLEARVPSSSTYLLKVQTDPSPSSSSSSSSIVSQGDERSKLNAIIREVSTQQRSLSLDVIKGHIKAALSQKHFEILQYFCDNKCGYHVLEETLSQKNEEISLIFLEHKHAKDFASSFLNRLLHLATHHNLIDCVIKLLSFRQVLAKRATVRLALEQAFKREHYQVAIEILERCNLFDTTEDRKKYFTLFQDGLLRLQERPYSEGEDKRWMKYYDLNKPLWDQIAELLIIGLAENKNENKLEIESLREEYQNTCIKLVTSLAVNDKRRLVLPLGQVNEDFSKFINESVYKEYGNLIRAISLGLRCNDFLLILLNESLPILEANIVLVLNLIAQMRHVEAMKALLQDDYVREKILDVKKTLAFCAQMNFLECIVFLQDKHANLFNLNERFSILNKACSSKSRDVVLHLTAQPDLCEMIARNSATLRSAVMGGDLVIFEHILNIPGMNLHVSNNQNQLLRYAIRYGSYICIARLLSISEVNDMFFNMDMQVLINEMMLSRNKIISCKLFNNDSFWRAILSGGNACEYKPPHYYLCEYLKSESFLQAIFLLNQYQRLKYDFSTFIELSNLFRVFLTSLSRAEISDSRCRTYVSGIGKWFFKKAAEMNWSRSFSMEFSLYKPCFERFPFFLAAMAPFEVKLSMPCLQASGSLDTLATDFSEALVPAYNTASSSILPPAPSTDPVRRREFKKTF